MISGWYSTPGIDKTFYFLPIRETGKDIFGLFMDSIGRRPGTTSYEKRAFKLAFFRVEELDVSLNRIAVKSLFRGE